MINNHLSVKYQTLLGVVTNYIELTYLFSQILFVYCIADVKKKIQFYTLYKYNTYTMTQGMIGLCSAQYNTTSISIGSIEI